MNPINANTPIAAVYIFLTLTIMIIGWMGAGIIIEQKAILNDICEVDFLKHPECYCIGPAEDRNNPNILCHNYNDPIITSLIVFPVVMLIFSILMLKVEVDEWGYKYEPD